MQITEAEYFVISELITMQDRELAEKIELAIWPESHIPDQEVLNRFADAAKVSEDDFGHAEAFAEKAKEILAIVERSKPMRNE